MRNLLSAHFARLWRSGWFWVGALVMVWFSWTGVSSTRNMLNYGEAASVLSFTLYYVQPLSIVLPVFAAVFLNGDYYYGTIRNKLATGRSRTAIYLADLVLVFLVGLIYTLAFLLINLGLGLSLAAAPQTDFLPSWRDILRGLPVSLAVALGIAALSVLLARLVTRRTVPLTALFLGLLLTFAAQRIDQILLIPTERPVYDEAVLMVNDSGETIRGYRKDGVDYTPEDCPKEPNPDSVGEPLHALLVFAQNFSPMGQAYQLSRGDVGTVSASPSPLGVLGAFAMGFSAVATGAGLLAFRRKDLK